MSRSASRSLAVALPFAAREVAGEVARRGCVGRGHCSWSRGSSEKIDLPVSKVLQNAPGHRRFPFACATRGGLSLLPNCAPCAPLLPKLISANALRWRTSRFSSAPSAPNWRTSQFPAAFPGGLRRKGVAHGVAHKAHNGAQRFSVVRHQKPRKTSHETPNGAQGAHFLGRGYAREREGSFSRA